jgi:HPt (histidine-containing phosphotransfer) domain-containing protein
MVTAKEALIREAERWSYSLEWKAAAAELKSLQGRWKEVGSAGNDDENLRQRFRTACGRFFERQRDHFEAVDRQRSENAARKERLCSTAESLRHSDDMKAAVSRVKALQSEWKTIGPAPKGTDDRLWNRFRQCCDEVFAAAHRDWERRHSEYEAKNQEWREKMHDTLRAKREQASRLRESIQHDEANVSRWRDAIYNLRPGGRADEIRDSLEGKISDVEDRISSKKQKLRELENDIDEIEAKLRR